MAQASQQEGRQRDCHMEMPVPYENAGAMKLNAESNTPMTKAGG